MFVCPECGSASQSPGLCPVDGEPCAPIGDDLVLGTTIGAYRIARLLGIGGMGRVYKGVHPTIGSRTAIKILSRECSDRRDLVDRFFAEAKAVNLIRHESIVNVLDLAMLPDGRPYIIMEYLDGAPLASIIEHAVATRTPLPLGGLARLAVEVLDALGAAHAKGIVHRDLKPDNIFVTPSGRPKVLDFGIAKLNDMTTGSATRTGSLLGTPHYMSPEQAAGRPVEHRADIYAIGVILYECVTGQKPFAADSLFELLRQHIETPPQSPRALRPDLSVELEHVIFTALAKQPEQRFASAQAMSVALQHATSQLAPEQWTPITGSGTHRAVPSGAWQPTPPASWGGTGTPRGPRESVQPPNSPMPMPGPMPRPHIGNQSTVSASAGQLQQAPTKLQKPASKNGVWIALGAVLLVGGGITAAVVAGGGGEPQQSAKQVEPAEPPAVVEPEEKKAKPETPKLPTQNDLDVAFEQLDQLDLSSLPPEARKQVEDMKKNMQQMPIAKRKQKRDDVQVAEAPESMPDDDAAGGGGMPTPKPAGTAPLWDGNFNLAGYKLNPKRLDVTDFIKYAVREAKRADPKSQLTRIDVSGVNAQGIADLTLPSSAASDHGDIDLRFVDIERGKPDPSMPKGVPHKETVECAFRIMGDAEGGTEIRTFSKAITAASMCINQKPIPVPRCSAKQVWAKAIAKGAPSDAVASLSFRASIAGGKIEWWFDIDGGFDARFADDC